MLVIAILISIIAAAIAVSVAKEKGRENDSWGVIAFIFPPALLFLLLAPKKTGTFNRECPYCKEVIKKEAIVCRYCGKDIVEPKPEPQGPETLIQPHEPAKTEPPQPVQQQSEPKSEPIQEKIIPKSKCRSCGMEMPKHKASCLYYRKKQGWSWSAKIFVALLITGLIIVVITILINISTAPTQVDNPSRGQPDKLSPAQKEVAVQKLCYGYGYKSGKDAAQYDRSTNHPYEPETLLAHPYVQVGVRMYGDTTVKHFGEEYRDVAERSFKEGFMDGYKESHNAPSKREA